MSGMIYILSNIYDFICIFGVVYMTEVEDLIE